MIWIPSVLTVFLLRTFRGKSSAVIFYGINKTWFVSFFVYRRLSLHRYRITFTFFDNNTFGKSLLNDIPCKFLYMQTVLFQAKYTDPQTKLRYSNTEEFARIKMMPGDLVTGCLTLRRANIIV